MGKDPESATGSTLLDLVCHPDDPRAWDRFVDRYSPKIWGWCRHWRLREADAEDVTQEVLTKLLRNLRRRWTYDPKKGPFRGWLRALVRNAWHDVREGRRRAGWASGAPQNQQLLDNHQAEEDLIQSLDEEHERELLERAQAVVRLRVDPATWQAFELTALQQWPGAEVATQLQMTLQAVWKAKSRVLEMLRGEVASANLRTPMKGRADDEPLSVPGTVPAMAGRAGERGGAEGR